MTWGDRGKVAVIVAFMVVIVWGMFGVMAWLRLG